MPSKNNNPVLSFSGIPKNALHNILYNLLKQQVQSGMYKQRSAIEPPTTIIEQRPTNNDQRSTINEQQSTNTEHQSTNNGQRTTNNRFLLYQYYKNYRLLNRLRFTALSLLNTQYAKKPKNPT